MRISEREQELLWQFADLSYPKTAFGHAEHIRLAWALLASQPLLAAMQAFRSQLQAFATHHDVAGLYNETITCFYLLLIRERMDAMGSDHDWAAFKQANPDLFGSPRWFLERWYPGARAFSAEAKQSFRLPA